MGFQQRPDGKRRRQEPHLIRQDRQFLWPRLEATRRLCELQERDPRPLDLTRAALDASLGNVEINIGSMTDEPARRELAEAADSYAAGLHRADEVIRTVRRKIAG